MKGAAVAGVDEAGLGPTLGPLVVGAALFRGSPEALADLYGRLDGLVARDPAAIPDRLAVDDSKRLFAGRRTLAPLELSALATLRPGAPLAARLEQLHDAPTEGWPPWYSAAADEPPLPVEADPALARAWRERWPAELAARGVEPVALFVRPVLEDELNACFRAGLNKAQAVLTRLAPVLRRLAARVPGDDLRIVVDRLGGRRYYADFLRTVFPLRPLAALEERETRSCYELRDGARTLTIAFEVEGDGRHFEVALASVAAKYVRELFVRRLNAHFARRKPGLRFTAGYPHDATRWLAEAADVLTASERATLVRER